MFSYSFENQGATVIDVYVEPWPEFYRLRPNERLQISFEAKSNTTALDIQWGEHGITFFPNMSDDQIVITIDGKDATERSWAY